ncbi:hypothetical protein HK102_003631 [Quaeritorhiza haematococci]|nr:hypothetical protein HK102_003631 [Quaeritorhiza haematococci]
MMAPTMKTTIFVIFTTLLGQVLAMPTAQREAERPETKIPGTYGTAVPIPGNNAEIEVQYPDGFQVDYQSPTDNSLMVSQNNNPSPTNPAGATPAFPYSWVVSLSNGTVKVNKAKVEMQFRGLPANANPAQIRFGLLKIDGSWDLNSTGQVPELDQKDQAIELERIRTIAGEWRAFVLGA